MGINLGNVVKQATQFVPGTFGTAARQVGGIDLTPGFNLNSRAGGGIPFVSRGNGSTGIAPPRQAQVGPQPQGQAVDATQQPDLSGAYTGGAGGGPSAQQIQDNQDRQNALYGIDNGINSANQILGGLGRQQEIGQGNIENQFNRELEYLTGQRQRSTQDFQRNQTDQLNQYGAARNQSATSARGWLDGARRTLGANGAGGGSAARYGVPYQAQQMAASGNAQAQANNTRNIGALTGAYQNDQTELNNSETGLRGQREDGMRDLQSRIENQRVSATDQLGQLSGQRAIAQGGDYNAALAASNPYTSKVQQMLANLDNLSIAPKLAARQVNLQRPDLSSYNFARPEAPVQAQQDASLGQQGPQVYDPYNEEGINPILALFGGDPNQRQFA